MWQGFYFSLVCAKYSSGTGLWETTTLQTESENEREKNNDWNRNSYFIFIPIHTYTLPPLTITRISNTSVNS